MLNGMILWIYHILLNYSLTFKGYIFFKWLWQINNWVWLYHYCALNYLIDHKKNWEREREGCGREQRGERAKSGREKVCVWEREKERERDTGRWGWGELGLVKDMTVKPCRSGLTCFCDILPGILALTISFDDHLSIRDLALLYYDLNIRTSWILVADIRGIVFLLVSGSETS